MKSLSHKKSTSNCLNCGKIFNNKKGGVTTKYCCRKCYGDSIRGIKKPKTHKSTCVTCSKIFYSSKKNASFCSLPCQRKSKPIIHKSKIKSICQKCGKEIHGRSGKKYCSVKCYHAVYYSRIAIIEKCKNCNKEFSTLKSKNKKFCSKYCYNKNYIKNLSQELKELKNEYRKKYYHSKNPRKEYCYTCKICMCKFNTKNKRQKFCGEPCRQKSYRNQPRVKIKMLIDVNKRYAQKHKTIGSLTLQQWESAKKYFNNCCAYCNKKTEKLQQDHFIPLKLGGNYVYENIIPACPKCNQSKNKKHPETWIKIKFNNADEIHHNILAYFKSIKIGNTEYPLWI